MYYNFVSFKETSSTLLMHIVHWPKKYDDTRTEHGIVWPHHRNVTHINSHMEPELTCFSVTSCKKFYTELKKRQKKESEGSVKPRNAEPSPPLQNSWEQLTLSSETLGKGFSVTPPPTYPSKGKKKVQFALLCKSLRDILISCWLWLLPSARRNSVYQHT